MNNRKSNQHVKSENEIDLIKLLFAILKNWWLILLAAVIFGAAAYCGAKLLIAPKYQSSFTAYINNGNSKDDTQYLSSGDLTTARDLAATYTEIIASKPNIRAAIEQAEEAGLENTYTYGYIKEEEMLKVETLNDTEILQISVITESPEDSYRLAAALQDTSVEFVESVVEGTSLNVISEAELPTYIYSPDYNQILVLGAALGVVVVLLGTFIAEVSDKRVRRAKDLEGFNLVVVGTIHDLKASEKYEYGYYKGGKN